MRVKRAAWHPRRVYQAVGLTRPTRPTHRAAVLAAAGKTRCAAVEAAVHARRALVVVFAARLVEGIKRLSLPSPRAPAQAERRPAARAPCTMEPRSWVPPAVSVEAP